MNPEEEPRAQPEPTSPPATGAEPRIIQLEDLLQGSQEVLIQHGDEFYRLRMTRNGRLLLTK